MEKGSVFCKRKWVYTFCHFFLILVFLNFFSTACVSDADKCDDMMLRKATGTMRSDMCIPKPDSDTIMDTNTDETAPDAGQDASLPDDDTGCTENADCPDNDYCDFTLALPVCVPPATGEDVSCDSPADCAGFEADYCESMVSFTCLVDKCSPEANNCSKDHICCDFSSYGLPSLCVARALNGDTCP